MSNSKPLGHDDSSGFNFAQEMLEGDITAAINFDRILLVFEFKKIYCFMGSCKRFECNIIFS